MFFHITSDKFRLFSYFILLAITGCALLQLPYAYTNGNVVPIIDALFTSVSAICVTGLSTVDMGVYTQFGFFIILLLIEFGGLGILTFISMLIAMPSKKVSLVNRRMVRDFFVDDVEANPRSILKSIFLFTLVIQVIGAVCLFPALVKAGVKSPVFDSFFLSVSAFCNAGFSPYSDNIESFANTSLLPFVIGFLIIAGGIGFTVLQNIVQVIFKQKKKLTMHSKIVLGITGLLIFGGALIFLVTEWNNAFANLPIHSKIGAAFFESVTTRTAGFDTIPQNQFSIASNLLTILLMFIGGSSGSIAGGIKTTTFIIVFLYILAGNEEKVSMNFLQRKIDPKTTGKALAIVSRSAAIIFLSIFLLSFSEVAALTAGKINLFDIMFETFSAFGTVGLSRGITSSLTFSGKIVIILTMFIGRTGLFAMALNVREHSIQKFIEYPEESILIG